MAGLSLDTSLSLLDQLRDARAEPAWEKLVAIYTPLIRSWMRAAKLQPADNDDLTQRTLQILLQNLSRFEHNGRPGAFRSWLRGIAVNVLRQFWGSSGKWNQSKEAGSVLDGLEDPSSDINRRWDEEYNGHLVSGLLDLVRHEFAHSTWEAFRRLTLEDAAPATVARELGLSVNAVYIAKARVMARLRQVGRGLLD